MGIPALSGGWRRPGSSQLFPGKHGLWRWVGAMGVGQGEDGATCLSSHVPTAFQALVRDQMPQPSSVGTEVDGGACKNISQGATATGRVLLQ